jgi:UDP-3-O-[3-hydroxymyristoyl] glucosamine N-acyltransferase
MDKDASGRYQRFPHVGGVRIGADVEIGSNVCIDRGSIGDTVICDGARIDNLVHVAHNVVIGENAVVIANAMLGGSARVERDSWIAPSASIMNQASVGAGAVVGLGAVVLRDVAANTVVAGNPARELERKGGE